ncbi:hypothetical protein AA0488_0102 [Kozakia baliensis NRIC 0488]|uniref:Uncharacterized protein n=1 Tax=Kozakia baliensis TaxID=153496 RepID=A0A1D8UUP5_9PROT|nr:hypothetical protein A0U89_08785 [Kozakia baliensis]GBR23306.1 hypothetical protein AA0488_0102 [Kozakia baliensis NRIC 0488]GEL65793.1 hypothetical protein KBA01_30790 [Kozakia baliensis]
MSGRRDWQFTPPMAMSRTWRGWSTNAISNLIILVFDKSALRDCTFIRAYFEFDHVNDQYIWLAGKKLHPSQRNSAVSRS